MNFPQLPGPLLEPDWLLAVLTLVGAVVLLWSRPSGKPFQP